MQTLLWESDLIADNILLFCITLGIYDFFQYLDQLLEKIGLLSTGMQPIRLPIGIGGISAGLSSKGDVYKRQAKCSPSVEERRKGSGL